MRNRCIIYQCPIEVKAEYSKYCDEHRQKKVNINIKPHLQSTYRTWSNLMLRINLDAYGIDPKWKKFDGFLEDMGEKPEGTVFCKIYKGEGYYKGNCHYKKRNK